MANLPGHSKFTLMVLFGPELRFDGFLCSKFFIKRNTYFGVEMNNYETVHRFLSNLEIVTRDCK